MTKTDELLKEFAEKYKTAGHRIEKDYSGCEYFRPFDNVDGIISDLRTLMDKLMPGEEEEDKLAEDYANTLGRRSSTCYNASYRAYRRAIEYCRNRMKE